MKRLFAFIKTYAFPYKRWYAGGCLALFLTNYAMSTIPRLVERAIDCLQRDVIPVEIVKNLVLSIIGLAVFLLVIRTVSRVLIFYPGRFVEFDLRNNLFRHLIRMPAPFYRSHRTGDLLSRVINDIQSLRLMVGFGFLHIMNTCFVFSLVLYQMLRIHPGLAMIALLPLPCFLLLSRGIVRKMHQRMLKNQECLGKITDLVVEAYSNISVVKTFGAEDSLTEQFDQTNREYQDINLGVARIRSTLFPLLHVMGPAGHFLIFLVGGSMVIRNELTLGEFTAFGLYIVQLAWPSAALGWIINLMQRGMVSLKRIDGIFSYPVAPLLEEQADSEIFRRPPVIEMRNLNFTFENQETPVLTNISFKLTGGNSLGIFGPTGSGKTVLANLITAMEEAPRETIFFDGIPIENIPKRLFFEKVSYVTQGSFLFSDSIEANIAYWNDGLDVGAMHQKALSAAEKAVVMHDINKFPSGMETLVGENGIILSGGQKNRTALARAFYKSGVVLVLDDVLSAVDHDTEVQLIQNIWNNAQKHTKVIISHRISALTQCDLILVLEKGNITAKGKHAELAVQSGLYRDTWLYQRMENSHV